MPEFPWKFAFLPYYKIRHILIKKYKLIFFSSRLFNPTSCVLVVKEEIEIIKKEGPRPDGDKCDPKKKKNKVVWE